MLLCDGTIGTRGGTGPDRAFPGQVSHRFPARYLTSGHGRTCQAGTGGSATSGQCSSWWCGRLDVLVNNAGMTGSLRAPQRGDHRSDAAGAGHQRLRVVAVTNAMLPLLRRSPACPHREHVRRAGTAHPGHRSRICVRGLQLDHLPVGQDRSQRHHRRLRQGTARDRDQDQDQYRPGTEHEYLAWRVRLSVLKRLLYSSAQ